MVWTFDEKSPIYIQLAQQLKMEIVSGQLKTGQQLPTVRELAEIAGVNPNTMQRSYSELEREGLVFSRRTAGRYVTEDGSLLKKIRRELAMEEMKSFVNRMTSIGYSQEEILEEMTELMKGEL